METNEVLVKEILYKKIWEIKWLKGTETPAWVQVSWFQPKHCGQLYRVTRAGMCIGRSRLEAQRSGRRHERAYRKDIHANPHLGQERFCVERPKHINTLMGVRRGVAEGTKMRHLCLLASSFPEVRWILLAMLDVFSDPGTVLAIHIWRSPVLCPSCLPLLSTPNHTLWNYLVSVILLIPLPHLRQSRISFKSR